MPTCDHSGARRIALAFTLCLSLLTLASCGKKSDGKLPVYPVKGQILVDGNPAKGVAITFWPPPLEKGLLAYCPSATTEENGYFTISTYNPGDGAPPGEYTVTIEWPIGFNMISNQWYGDHLQGKYSNQGTSDIKVKIEAKPNELAPIRIEMPPKKKS